MKEQHKQTQGSPETKAQVVKWLDQKPWLKLHRPIQNEALKDEDHPDDCMFETSGSEFERVKAAPENKIWTLVQEGRHHLLYPGFHRGNIQGYFICEVPWEHVDLVVNYLTEGFLTAETAIVSDYPGDRQWMLEVGAECNRLLDLAETLEKSSKKVDQQYAADLRSIINRVAEFEELETL